LGGLTFAFAVSAGVGVIRGCEFDGTPGSCCISITGGTQLTVTDNQFRFGGPGSVALWNRSGSTLARLNVLENNFSQSAGGSMLLDTTPAAFRHVDNYGTVGPGLPE
jgi:hypothetical protein